MNIILFLRSLLFLSLSPVAAQNGIPQVAEGLINVHNLFNASDNTGVSCYRIPAMVTATNGDLVAAIDERVPSCQDLRGSRDINIVIRRSSDQGKNWSEIENIVDFPQGLSASDLSMIVDRVTGEIFLFYNFMDLDKEQDVYYLHVVKSRDQGKSWSKGKTIYPGSAAYSSMTVLDNGYIGLFFEKDYYTENLFVSFSLEYGSLMVKISMNCHGQNRTTMKQNYLL